jgi:hypothetical protein
MESDFYPPAESRDLRTLFTTGQFMHRPPKVSMTLCQKDSAWGKAVGHAAIGERARQQGTLCSLIGRLRTPFPRHLWSLVR